MFLLMFLKFMLVEIRILCMFLLFFSHVFSNFLILFSNFLNLGFVFVELRVHVCIDGRKTSYI